MSGGVSFPDPTGSPKVERRRRRRRRRPGSKLKALRRSRRGLAGGRVACGRGRCRQTGRGWAGLRPYLAPWEPGLRETRQAVGAFKTERKKRKAKERRSRRFKVVPGTWKPHIALPAPP